MFPLDAYYRVTADGKSYLVRIRCCVQDVGGPESGPKFVEDFFIRDVRDAATGRPVAEPHSADPYEYDAWDQAIDNVGQPVYVIRD